jgi:hypothetical protein
LVIGCVSKPGIKPTIPISGEKSATGVERSHDTNKGLVSDVTLKGSITIFLSGYFTLKLKMPAINPAICSANNQSGVVLVKCK